MQLKILGMNETLHKERDVSMEKDRLFFRRESIELCMRWLEYARITERVTDRIIKRILD